MLKNSSGLSSYRGFGVPSSRTISRGTFYRGENPADYSKRMLEEKGDPLAEYSTLSPEKIIGKQKPTKEQALRFVSGNSPIGDSIVSGAKNKIVRFDRNIKPKPNNLQSLIGNLASNIFSTSSVSNIFNTTEKEKTPEKKEKGFKPFGGFFDRIKEALAFITFFGSKKNLDRIRENVDNLKTTFAETFEVAKSLRKVILKIIKQISGLSGGGGGGEIIGAIMSALGGLVGGLIPGMGGKRPPNVAGPAMKKEGNLLSKIPKGLQGGGISKLLLGGAAALGTGAAISGLSQPGDEYVQPGGTTPEVPGNVLDKFNSILDRFDKVIESLMKGKGPGSQKPSGSPGSSGGGGGGGSPTPTLDSPVDETVSPEVDAAGLKSNFAPIAQDILESGKIDSTKLSDRAAMGAMLSVGQMESNYPYDKAYSGMGGKDMNMKGFLQLNKQYHKVSGEKQYLDYTIPKFKGEDVNFTGGGKFNPLIFAKYLKNAKTGSDVANAMKVAGFTVNDFEPLGSAEAANRLSENQVVAIKKIVFGNINLQNASSVNPKSEVALAQAPPPPTLPAPKPAPGQAPQAPTRKLAPGQQSIQVIPFEQQQSQVQPAPSGGGGQISAPPSPKQNGPTAPFLPSSNPNNFLTLYSRMVYNIVDG